MSYPALLPYAMDYGRIISFGMLFFCIDSGMAGMIRADGSPKYSMAGLQYFETRVSKLVSSDVSMIFFIFGYSGSCFNAATLSFTLSI